MTCVAFYGVEYRSDSFCCSNMLVLAYFQQTEKIGKLRFGTFVLIESIRMEAI